MVEISSSATRSETRLTPERQSPYTPLLGLQGRLAIGGEALFPSTKVELTQGIDTQKVPATLSLLRKASEQERDLYWSTQNEQLKSAQLEQWKKSITAKIHLIPSSTLGHDHIDFFKRIGIDPAQFDEQDAQTLYTAYFSKDTAANGAQSYVKDVVKSYTVDGKTNITELQKHLAAVQWMAGIFGKNSAEIVAQLIDTEIESVRSPADFVLARKDKVNALSPHEAELLTFLTQGADRPAPLPPKSEDAADITVEMEDLPLTSLEDMKKNNARAARQFVAVMRSELKPSSQPDFLENKFKMHIQKDSGFFDVSNFAVLMGDRYNLPLGIMVRGAHAFLITNGPHKQGDKWYLSVWNPFGKGGRGGAGTEEVELYGDYSQPEKLTEQFLTEKNLDPQQPDFIINEPWLTAYNADPQSANLEALLDQSEFAGVREQLRDIKFSALQQSNSDCVPLCGYLGAILNRLSNDSLFVTSKKFEQFETDFGIHLMAKDEITPPPFQTTQEDEFFMLLAGKKTIQEVDKDAVVREYQKDPTAHIKKMQELVSRTVLQMKKEGKTEAEIKTYINTYLATQILLDHKAFPADDIVKKGVPSYLPDGLSDMGSDSEIDDAKRTREKIRVDKEKTFANSTDLLYQIFTTKFSKTASEKDKQLYLTRLVSAYVHNKIRYDYQDKLDKIYGVQGQSINMGDIEQLRLGVCRHHALDTQVLLQSLGIDSRLMKSDFENLGPHANNLVHIEGKWYLIDTTNPEFSPTTPPSYVPYIKELPEPVVDLNAQVYTWDLDEVGPDGKITKRKYVSRNNMYYRVRDNKKNPTASHYKN